MAATVFNDKIFADIVLQQVVDMLAPLNAFSTDISSAARAKGDSVTVSLYGNTVTTTFTQATDVYEQSGGTVSAVTVTLDHRKITPVALTAQQLIDSSAANRMEAFAVQMAQSTASAVLQDVLSVLTVTNFGAPTTTSSANFKLDALVALRIALNSKLCPSMGRNVIVNSGVEAGLFSDTNIVLATNRGNGDTINKGTIGPLIGFDNIFTSTVFPSNSISLIGVACGKSGVAVAMRQIGDVLPDEEYAAVEVVEDPVSGIAMTYSRHWSRAQGIWFMNMHALYGFSKAVTKQVHLVCTATT